MKSLKEFLNLILDAEKQSNLDAVVNRNKELVSVQNSKFFTRYAIQIIVEGGYGELLHEDQQYKQFKKSTDLYFKHPENPNIPVKAHYHVVDNKSKKEIYAVNIDGTAHHRDNRGFEVPKKQADQLRSLGVSIKPDNILESKQLDLNESIKVNTVTFFLIFEE